MTKAQLKKYKEINLELKQLERQLEELEAEAYGIKSAAVDGAPPSQKKSAAARDFSEVLVKLLELRAYYEAKWDELIDMRSAIEKAIEGLEPKERTLMRARYVEGLTWEEVAVLTNYSIQHVWRVHGSILRKMRENES